MTCSVRRGCIAAPRSLARTSRYARLLTHHLSGRRNMRRKHARHLKTGAGCKRATPPLLLQARHFSHALPVLYLQHTATLPPVTTLLNILPTSPASYYMTLCYYNYNLSRCCLRAHNPYLLPPLDVTAPRRHTVVRAGARYGKTFCTFIPATLRRGLAPHTTISVQALRGAWHSSTASPSATCLSC